MLKRTLPEKSRNYILQNSRLLERQLFGVIFDSQPVDMCIKALAAYQNEDGGFGNGIEPDLLTPASTGIGLETACYYIDQLLHSLDKKGLSRPQSLLDMLDGARKWVEKSIGESGIIPTLVNEVKEYPHQAWWLNHDDTRILSIAGYLAKFNINLEPGARKQIEHFAESLTIPDTVTEYNYPLFLYVTYETTYPKWDEVLDTLQRKLTEHIYEKDRDSYFLLSRYWYHFIDMMPEELVEDQVDLFYALLEDDGGVINPFPDLTWWRPIVTLDYFLILYWLGAL